MCLLVLAQGNQEGGKVWSKPSLLLAVEDQLEDQHGCAASKDWGLQLVGHLCLPDSRQSGSPQVPALTLTHILAGKEREMREERYRALS